MSVIKKSILAVLGVVASTSAMAPIASASDQLVDEIVCSRVQRPGEADRGLDVIVQSNPTAWMKRAAVNENGYLGSREIGAFNVPLNPRYVRTGRTLWMIYDAKGFQLAMQVYPNGGLKGPASAVIQLPGYDVIRERLLCKKAR